MHSHAPSIYLLFALAFAAARPAFAQGERAIAAIPLDEVSAQDFSGLRQQSYGVFVGVDRFLDEESIGALRFAVADARAARDCFVESLRLIPPQNAKLLVSGAAEAERPTRGNILGAIDDAARLAGPDGGLIVYLSSHGIENYILAEDSRRSILNETAIALASLEGILGRSRCPRRFLILDACRETPGAARGTKSLESETMSPAFAEAFLNASGFAVLKSCDGGQVSYEDSALNQGVFTHFLLEGLTGGAQPGPDGLLTVTRLAKYVQREVENYTANKPSGVQKPRFDMRDASADLPLAFNFKTLQREATLKLSTLYAEGKLTHEQYQMASEALFSADPKRKKVALDVAEGKVPAEYIEVILARIPDAPAPAPPASTPVPASAPTPEPPPAAAVPAEAPRSDFEEVVRLTQAYYLASARGDVESVLAFYHPGGLEDDFGEGPANWASVEKGTRAYYAQWRSRQIENLGIRLASEQSPNRISVVSVYDYRFVKQSDGSVRSGRSITTLHWAPYGGSWKIAAAQEEVIRN
ncbi:MAG: Caspase domain protein [candidate division BRC1 bacterium ADurb.BinA364]|nr:MAG: Caspase domain protein [candidate division BRC1 bacterium ADurb.BinA364]